ncbi:hypothetical protein EVA_08951 [gut metagenome]|uniref:Uncharacterized protein n=1 Tax=gut metagenome TaxID=749906 RepID=J9G6Q9_9ZZZZ
MNSNQIDTIKKVFPKSMFFNHLKQISIGSRNHSYIHLT